VVTIDQNPPELDWGTEVVETFVLGQPCRVFARRPKHLSELLRVAGRFPNREYLVQGQTRMTFEDHQAAVSSTSARLRQAGLRRGQRVLLLGANAVEWIVSFWAILEAEGVVVLGNAWWGESEVHHAVEVASPDFAVVDEKRSVLLPESVRRIPYAEVDTVGSVTPDRGDRPPANGEEDDPAVILFTSGTTGLPKGAVLTHRGLLAVLQSLLFVTRRIPVPGSAVPTPSRALLSLPLFHIGGLQQILTPMATGGTIVFADGRFDPARVVRILRDERVAVWSAVPTMVARVLDYLEESPVGTLDDVRTVGMGGSPVPQQLRERVTVGFPNASKGVAVTYGLSEACGVVATGVGHDVTSRPGCVGRPLPTCEIRIDDPSESGEGEIVVRSPSVMLGYMDVEVHSAESPVTSGRWLRTGDIGRFDEDGYLYVTDRSKDIVIRGGENIATPNVEDRLLRHPAISEVAVIGLPHTTLGEELAAAVVLREGAHVTPEELAKHVGARLAHFEVPTRWWIGMEALPRNSTGKVLKRTIRTMWINRDKIERGPQWEDSTAR
jgi:long-chain acyl-CoA synthetase